MIEMRVQGYENQVKLFLVLLVLFLAAAGAAGLNVLYRAQSLLMEEAQGRITAATRAVQRELEESGVALVPGTADRVAAAARLVDLARAFSLSSLEIVGLDGRIVSGIEPWRRGVEDPESLRVLSSDRGALNSGGAVLAEPDPGDGDEEYGRDRAQVLVFVALSRGGPEPVALLKAGHEVIGIRTISRQIRALVWAQALAGVVVLALMGLFARWVLRPYRALKEAAAQIEARDRAPVGGEPEDLISSFRGVIGKLKEQETELDRLRAHAGAGGPPALTREMLDGLASGVLIIGQDSRVTALNPAGEKILGTPAGALLGRDYREVFSASPDLVSILRDGVERGRAHSREVVPYAGGPASASSPSHLGVTLSTLPGPGRSRQGAFCIFSDLTEIRGLQERVRLKESLAGLGTMSAGIAHEFRNSLATILGYSQLITREAEAARGAGARTDAPAPQERAGDPAWPDHAAAIAREVRSIGRVVDDFLRYARPARIEPSDWDPRLVVEQVASQVLRECGRAGVRITLAGEWPASMRGDEGLLRQAFQNLLRNAVEAIAAQEGLVVVTACLEEQGEQLRIEVADSGTGIPQEVLDRLFTPFVTTKQRGTGLGLALAQKAIVSHDGTITARNADGGGACFTLRLPLAGT